MKLLVCSLAAFSALAAAVAVSVPNVVGLGLNEARARLAAVQIGVGRAESEITSDRTLAGKVKSQSIPAGQKLQVPATINLVFYASRAPGATPVAVPPPHLIEAPDVVGTDGNVALLLLEARGFAGKRQESPASDSKQWGRVIRQDPPPGTKALPKTVVTVFVAMGVRQLTVPNVVGMKPVDAMRVVREAGLIPASMVPQTVPTTDWNKVRIPTIGKQTPAAGARVAEGTKVGLESYVADTVAVPT